MRGIFISLDVEEKITLADVRSSVREQFNTNAERVTKKFYQEFKTQHTAFLKFIKGIENVVDQEWYASLMLNRLMFIYFIQKKSFLDDNPNYLNDKLKETQKKKGKDKFYSSFYRNFLLVLFHKGLGSPERDDNLLKEIGKVPYLNGGLFDEHQIEKNYEIEIEDKAFEKIFNFFDEYNWHLDTKITATGSDINPDVIGYIFEKYINARADMGAYYTKEDITDYIAKNTILPFIFDEVKKDCAVAFKPESSLWKMLKENPDRYIYDAVKHGIYADVVMGHSEEQSDEESQKRIRCLPPVIQIGLETTKPKLLERRKEWNKTAPFEFALPTEIWREVVERRTRYFDMKSKIENGEIKETNDFITYNLNIRQFAQDAVYQYEGSDFINAFYKAINKITILDPTCGSGAFLFAALNILEPLYEECIRRMRRFVLEDDSEGGKKFSQFRKVLDEIKHHPNEKYYIYKSIILNNLYGVDIMNEAVEIAKLRLFLKLVAEVEDFDHLEPLPDIDFNIRTGNTLVGFASAKEMDNGLSWSFDYANDRKKIYDEIEIVSKAFKRYKVIQLEEKLEHNDFKKAKDELNERLKKLNISLNDYLGNEYGKNRRKEKDFEGWLSSYKPFHWFAEFYEIIESGGFNIIIGNPPYIEYSKVRKSYILKNFNTLSCGNIYSVIIERSTTIVNSNGYMGMITQNSIVCTKRMYPIQKFLMESFNIYFSNYDDRPAKLFTGMHHMKGSVFVAKKVPLPSVVFSTKFYRWYEEFRGFVFQNLKYMHLNKSVILKGHISKISDPIHFDVFKKIYKQKQLSFSLSSTGQMVYCHRIASYFIKAIDFVPYFFNEIDGEKKSDDYKTYFITDIDSKKILLALLNSNIFYINWHTLHDGYHCGKLNIEEYPFTFPQKSSSNSNGLIELSKNISHNLKMNSKRKETYYKNTGIVIYDEFYPKLSKPIIDEIDKVLAEHYSFTEEELDFIINYDIKYRMGKALEED